MVNKFIVLLIGLMWAVSASGQSTENKNNEWLLKEKLPDWVNHSFNKVKLSNNYKIADYINPFYLQADFNGDEKIDIAIAIENKETKKKGFVIFHAATEDFFVIGAGKEIQDGLDDFSWMDIWKVNRKHEINEVTYDENAEIEGNKVKELKNVGITVAKSESASGLISWDGQKYFWIQLGD